MKFNTRETWLFQTDLRDVTIQSQSIFYMILSYRIHLEISKKLKRQTNETTNEKS